MPTLPRRTSSRDLSFECNISLHTEEHAVEEHGSTERLEYRQQTQGYDAKSADQPSRWADESQPAPDRTTAPPDMNRTSTTGSKVSAKTDLISEDSTSGWSDQWSPPPPNSNNTKRFVEFHKTASLPTLLTTASTSTRRHSDIYKPHHYPGGLPSAVRRLVQRSRSVSPTNHHTHPGIGRFIQAVVANVVRKEPCHSSKGSSTCSKDPPTEFMEPSSSLHLGPKQSPSSPRVYPDDSVVFQIEDLRHSRSSSSGSQRSGMFRSKLFKRSSS